MLHAWRAHSFKKAAATMPATSSPINQSHVQSFGNIGGFKIEYGQATFTTTATSETIKTNLTRIFAVLLTPGANIGSGDTPQWQQGVSTGSYVPTDGTFTVVRQTGTTSGFPFSYLAIGI